MSNPDLILDYLRFAALIIMSLGRVVSLKITHRHNWELQTEVGVDN